jgi:hypothetical protein
MLCLIQSPIYADPNTVENAYGGFSSSEWHKKAETLYFFPASIFIGGDGLYRIDCVSLKPICMELPALLSEI